MSSTSCNASGVTWLKSSVKSPFDHLDITSGMVPLMILWHYVTLTQAAVALHEKKLHYTIFNDLDLMNGMVLLTVTLVSYHADASANSVK